MMIPGLLPQSFFMFESKGMMMERVGTVGTGDQRAASFFHSFAAALPLPPLLIQRWIN